MLLYQIPTHAFMCVYIFDWAHIDPIENDFFRFDCLKIQNYQSNSKNNVSMSYLATGAITYCCCRLLIHVRLGVFRHFYWYDLVWRDEAKGRRTIANENHDIPFRNDTERRKNANFCGSSTCVLRSVSNSICPKYISNSNMTGLVELISDLRIKKRE